MPQRIEMQKGEPFVLNGDVQIIAGEGLQQEAGFLQAYLKDLTDLSLSLASRREKKRHTSNSPCLPRSHLPRAMC